MYECYTADMMYYINRVLGVQVQKRYSEYLESEKQVDSRSPQEIVDDLTKRLGLKVVG